MHFVVRQHKPHKNKWNDVSFYNESGNFLGPAIFNTKREAEEYLKQYESRMLAHLAGVNNNTTPNNQKKKGGGNQIMMAILRRITIREENQVEESQQYMRVLN